MESDAEIEYLDEDADIVQQCVQTVPVPVQSEVYISSEKLPLLVERPTAGAPSFAKRKKRKKEQQEDSDYDPAEDNLPNSPDSSTHSSRSRKRKVAAKRTTRARVNSPYRISIENAVRSSKKNMSIDINRRKNMDIRIPDYDDPLCLPVKAQRVVMSDVQRLKTWNNVCLEHFRRCDTLLRPEKGPTNSSTRTVVLRNVVHRDTGKAETAVWSKTSVINKQGVKKSEIFQSILPKYREKKILNTYNLLTQKKIKKFHYVEHTLLTKEEYKNSEVLVVYKPKESLSAVYKFVDKNMSEQASDEEEEPKRSLKEVACCKVCAPCYQTSWRGAKKEKSRKIPCPVCGRSTVSVYNLLTHLKAHSTRDVHKHKGAISVTLAGVVDYHYRCRICEEQFLSIKSLRQHVVTHKGTESFRCEVGNHMTS